jgi:thiol-disulfide isomerase/thioredoxin
VAPAAASGGPPVPAIAIGLLVLVAVVGIAVAVVSGSDDDPTGDGLVFGTVDVAGEPLPSFEQDGSDPAEGQAAPRLDGVAVDGTPTTVEGGEPTILVFLAHWCPHCRAELPRIVEVADEGGFDGIRLVAVLTGTNPDAPNFPPGEWLEREGWTGDVIVDDEHATAAKAYGLTGYPFLTVVDADGAVLARTSAELPPGQLEALGELARAGAS